MFAVQILSVHKDLAGGRLQKTVQVLNKGGFAGTGMADDAEKFTVFNRHADIIERDGAQGTAFGIAMGQVADFDGHKTFSTSLAISSTVRMPLGRGIPSLRSSSANDVICGTSRCISFIFST